MQHHISINIPSPNVKIQHADHILLIGSCFTEHIGHRFKIYNWSCLENPSGIVFNPDSMDKTIERVVNRRLVQADELIYHNELWQHWDFHSRYAHLDKDEALEGMNQSIEAAHDFIANADWIFLTLGTAYQYFTVADDYGVSNCHKVPANQFVKRLLTIDVIKENLNRINANIKKIKSSAKIIYTISPVRHIKDGVIENNRSKARLIEAVHSVVNHDDILYFPAYELLIDVLRDYRYYDADLVHPNYAATQSVWEVFVENYLDEAAQDFLKKMIALRDGYNHRTRFPETRAHYLFLKNYLDKIATYEAQYPNANFNEYRSHFEGCIASHPLSSQVPKQKRL